MWGMNRLGPSLVAGALAAAGLFLVRLGSGSVGLGGGYTALYWMAFALVFSAAGASRRSDLLRRFGVAGLGVAGIVCGWLGLVPEWDRFFGASMSLLAVGLTFVFGAVRSGLFDEANSLNLRRVLVVEGVLGVAALAFGAWLIGPGPFGPALALWGFALVQSLYACVPRSFLASPNKRIEKVTDPFDVAIARLESALGEVLH